MRANKSDSRENFTRANGAGASRANSEATATGARAFSLYKAKYFVIALLLAVVAITSVGVSKWNIHIQQKYNNNFSYLNTEPANTSGGAGGDPILTRYLTIDYTETAQNTPNATAESITAYYRDTLPTEQNPNSKQTTFTYNGGSFKVKVSDGEYGDLKTDENGNYVKDENGNYVQNNPDASPWSEWATVGLVFSYTYYKTHDYDTNGNLTEKTKPTELESDTYPTEDGKYKCVITAIRNEKYDNQTSGKKAAVDAAIEQLNYLKKTDDGPYYAAEISFTINPRPIKVTIDNKFSAYGDAIVQLTATTEDVVAIADNNALNGDDKTLNKIVSLSAKDKNGDEISNKTNVGTYDIIGKCINANYDVTFGKATQTQGQKVSFNGEREAEANPLALYVGAGATAVSFANNTANNTAVVFTNNTAINVAGKPQTQPMANGGVALLGGESPTGGNETGNEPATNGTYTITTRKITVTIDNQTSDYGDAIKVLNYSVTSGSLANGNTLENIIRVTTTATSTSNVGTYPIIGSQYNADGQIINANYAVTFVGNATNGKDGVYTITKRPVTITWGETGETAFSYVYNGTEQKPNPTFKGLLDDLNHKATVTVTAQSGSSLTSGQSINKGDYTMTVALPSQNYKWKDTEDDSTDKTQGFEITARPITVTIADKSSTYGNPLEPLTATTTDTVAIDDDKKANGGTLSGNLNALITLSAKDASGNAITNKSPVGTYDITGSQNEGFPAQNYNITFENGTYKITARQINVTIENKQSVYGKNHLVDNPLTATTTDAVAIADGINTIVSLYTNDQHNNAVTLSTTTDAGTYIIKGECINNNYTVSFTEGTYTIQKATITATITPYSGVYDGNTHDALTVTVKTVNSQTATVYYRLSTETDYTVTPPQIKDAGTYNYSVKITANNHNDLVIENNQATISKATVTVKANDASVNMGQQATFIYTMTGFKNGETETGLREVDALTGNVTFACDYNKDETNPNNVNDTYVITPVVSDLSATNYTFTPDPAPGTLTVNKNSGITKPTADTSGFTYNGNAHTYTPVGFDSATMNITGNVQTNAGTYTVTVVPKNGYVWKDTNGTEEVNFTFKIEKREITVNIDDKTSVYGAAIVQPTATTTDDVANADGLYNIIALSAGITTTTAVGDYLITGALKNTEKANNYTVNFVGSLQNGTAGKYTITNATISNVVVTPYSGTYDGVEHPVTTSVTATTVNNNEITVEYKTNNGVWTSTIPTITNAGSVTFNVRISALNHDTLTLTESYTATINKATPTATLTIVAESPRAPDLIEHGDTLIANITLTGVNGNISDFTYTLSKDTAEYTGTSATANQTITCTITPKDTTNYNNVTVTVEITVTAVAKSGNTYYGTIESALSAVSSGTVYVLVGKNPLIRNDCTIKSGVTLCLPLGDDGTWENIGNNGGTNGSHKFAKDHAYGNKNLLKASAVLSAGKTLTNLGTLNIGGTITAGNGGANAGFTCGNYSQLTLEANAKVDSPSGSIKCYGYIAEESLDNGSAVVMGNANAATPTLTLPFVVIEHRGGTAFAGLANSSSDLTSNPAKINATPFNRFLLPNITAELTVNYGAKLEAFADLYANSQHNTTTVNLIGTDDKYLLSITSDTKVVSKYNPETKVTDLNIKGDANINSLTLELSVGLTAKLSTEPVYFPLSWYFNITLSKFENGSNATVTAAKQALKILPGCVVTIDEGVTANMKTIFVTQDTSWTEGSGTGAESYDGNGTANPKAPGKLIVNGTLNVENINGVISTESSSGQLTITGSINPTSKEVKKAGSTTYNILVFKKIPILTYTVLGTNETARGLIWTSANTTPTTNSNFSTGTYKSDGAHWYKTGNYTITYDTQGGTLPENYKTTAVCGEAIGALPTPTKLGYKFDGWTYNLDGENITVETDTVFYVSIELVATWTKQTYTVYMNNSHGETTTQTFTGNTTFTLPQLGSVTVDGQTLSFAGWYKDSSFAGASITSVNANDADNNLHINVYAKFTAAELYSVTYVMNKDNLPFTTTINNVTEQDEDYTTLNLLDMTSYNTNPEFNYKFIGWYNESGEQVTQIDGTVNNLTLYAHWEAKKKVTLTNKATYKVTTSLTQVNTLSLNAGESKILYYYNDTQLALGDITPTPAKKIDADGNTAYIYKPSWKTGNSVTITADTTLEIVGTNDETYYKVTVTIEKGTSGNNIPNCSVKLTIPANCGYEYDFETKVTTKTLDNDATWYCFVKKGTTVTAKKTNCQSGNDSFLVNNAMTQSYKGKNGSSGGCGNIKETSNTPPAMMPIFTTFIATLLGGYILVSKKKRKNNKAI